LSEDLSLTRLPLHGNNPGLFGHDSLGDRDLHIEPDEEWVRAVDVIDEVTIASANIDDGVSGVGTILEEVLTEDLPDTVFSRLVAA
jgi:hypothetical protein